MTDPLSPTAGGAPAAGAAPPAEPGQLDKDAFLQLLVAQMRYQDPLQPTDAGALMNQTAQLAVVERLEELGNQQGELLAGQRAAAAAGLIGRQVAWDADGVQRSGAVTGARILPTGHVLIVDDEEVPLADVTEVHQAS